MYTSRVSSGRGTERFLVTATAVALALSGLDAHARPKNPSHRSPKVAATTDEARCFGPYETVQELRSGGKLREALAAAGSCSDDACPGEIASACRAWVTELRDEVPSLVVSVRDADGRDLAATLRIDGKEVAPERPGAPLLENPGAHRVDAFLETGEQLTEEVVLLAGEQRRPVAFVWNRPGSEDRPFGFSSPGFWVGTGVFVAGAVVAGIGTSERLRLEACRPNCSDADLTRASGWLTAADVGFVAASVGAGSALLFLFLDRPAATPVRAGVSDSGFFATYSGAF